MPRGRSADWRDVWEGMRRQPGRAGLSFLAMAIGMLVLTLLLAIQGGLNERARRLVRELGVNVAALQAEAGEKEPPPGAGLSLLQVELLRANLSPCRLSGLRRYEVASDAAGQPLAVVATDESLAAVRQWRLIEGRFLDAEDMRRGSRHAVVSRGLAQARHWRPGSVIPLQGDLFVVVGTVDTGDAAALDDGALRQLAGHQAVFIPRTAAASWVDPASRGLDAVFIQIPAGLELAPVVRRAQRLLTAPDAAVERAAWVTPESLLAGLRRLQQTIKLSLGSISMLCLALGGTTLMSLMLANVRDRVAEIGLRRALGASPGAVAALFVMEAGVLAVAAALAGGALGALIIAVAGARSPVPLQPAALTFIVPGLASLLLAAIFSFWPARLAARIAPAEALRNE